jgi:hypothetical protein
MARRSAARFNGHTMELLTSLHTRPALRRSPRTIAPALLAALAFGAPAIFADDLPATTPEGLELVQSERLDVVYWRPGATLAAYKRVALAEATIAFEKTWIEKQNRPRKVYKADAEDMQRIRGLLAQEFRTVFSRELAERGKYEIVDTAGEDVLLLRPSIVDLVVAAPDLGAPGMVINHVTSTGEMTLLLELYDSVTNSLIGRVIDRQHGSDVEGFLITDRIKNQAEADKILTIWASTLREALDAGWSGHP